MLPVTLIYSAVYLLVILLPDHWAPGPREVFYEWAMLPVALVAALGAGRVANAQRAGSASRRAWVLVAASFASWLLASLVWMALDYPEVSIADIGFIGFYPLIISGLLSFPTRGGAVSRRPEFWIDVGTIAIGGFMLVWHFALAQTISSDHEGLLEAIVNFSYPILSLILLLGSVTVWLRDPSAEVRRALGWLTVGAIAFCGADIVYAAQTLTGTYTQGGLADAGWFLATVAFVLATSDHGRPRSVKMIRAVSRIPYFDARYLPYVAIACGYGILLYATAARSGPGTGVFIACGAVLTILVLIRQIRSVLEFAAVEASQAASVARERTEARLRALVRNSSDVVIIASESGRIRFTTPPMERDFGYAPDSMVGKPLLEWVHPEDAELAKKALSLAEPNPARAVPVRFRVSRSCGGWRLVEGTATDMRHEETIGAFVLNLRDITEREHLEALLRHRALHDPLTGLANRALFRERVEQALARCARSSSGVALLYIDLDDFKRVNDAHGHAVGDRLLAHVGERLLHATRGADTVGRLGGDEFAILQEDVHCEGEVLPLASRILEAVTRPVVLDDREVAVRLSIGIAYAERSANVDELIDAADQAMYRMKKAKTAAASPVGSAGGNPRERGESPLGPHEAAPTSSTRAE